MRISESLLCAAACPLHSFSGRLCGRNALRACAGDTMETTETATAENQRDLGKKRGRRSSVRECEVSDAPRERWCGPCNNRRLKKPCEGLHPDMQIGHDCNALENEVRALAKSEKKSASFKERRVHTYVAVRGLCGCSGGLCVVLPAHHPVHFCLPSRPL